jgi:Flp pilus assembly pilin Flp
MMNAAIIFAHLVRRFAKSKSATSAIEFGLIAPVLTTAVIGLSDASTIGIGSSKMQSAVRASIQYVMNGGIDLGIARTQGLQAWDDIPTDATMTVSQACYCGGAAGTCGVICSDGSVPSRYITSVASGTLGGDMLKYKKTVTETVRIQ